MMGIAVEALMRVAEGRPALRAHGHPALVKRRPSRDSSSPGPSAKRPTTGATDDVFANDALHCQAVLQSPLPPRCIFSRKTRLDTGRQSAIVRSKAVLQSREARAEEDEAYLTFRMEMFAGAAPEDAVAKLARAYSLTCPEMALRLLGPARLGGAVPDATGESTMMGIAVEALMRVAEGRPALRAHGHPALVKRRPRRDSSSPGPSAKRPTLEPPAPRVGGPGEEAPRDEDREEGFPWTEAEEALPDEYRLTLALGTARSRKRLTPEQEEELAALQPLGPKEWARACLKTIDDLSKAEDEELPAMEKNGRLKVPRLKAPKSGR